MLLSHPEYLIPAAMKTIVRPDPEDLRFSTLVRDLEHTEPGAHSVVIVGVPQHIGVERNGGRPGSEEAPAAIRKALYALAASHGTRSVCENVQVIDAGDVDCRGRSLEQIHMHLKEVLSELLSTKALVIVLGGGHDLAWPDGAAVQQSCASMAFINVDAHPDVRPMIEVDSELLCHSGSGFRQLLESGRDKIEDDSCTVFGIQAFTAAGAHLRYIEDRKQRAMMLDECRRLGVTTAYHEALERAAKAEALYCSFDIDAIGGAYAPGVSAVAVDGFDPQQAIAMVRAAATHMKTRLIDFVECNPRHDTDGRTVKLVAHLVAHALDARSEALKS